MFGVRAISNQTPVYYGKCFQIVLKHVTSVLSTRSWLVSLTGFTVKLVAGWTSSCSMFGNDGTGSADGKCAAAKPTIVNVTNVMANILMNTHGLEETKCRKQQILTV